MVVLIGPFEAIEIVSLVFSIIAFAFVYRAYKKGVNDAISKKFWTYFLLIVLFGLLGRLFSNIEEVAFMPYFNLLEHLSRISAAVFFFLVAKYAFKGELVD